MIVSPSLLSADFGNLNKDLEMINSSDAQWLHIDVMDGVFVPNISFGFPVLEYVKRVCTKPLDVHLMIVEPQKFISEVKSVGASIMNVHYEAVTHLDRTINQIKEAGMKAGVTLNPSTPVSVLHDIITEVDLVLIMSVNPGFAKQKFIPYATDKVCQLRQLIDATGSNALIEVDGGVNAETAPLLAQAGADVLVAGSYVFHAPNPLDAIHYLAGLDTEKC